MTMRRVFVLGLILSGLSIIPWVRAEGTAQKACGEPIVTVDPEECTGGNHDEAMQRYRSNQSRHWRHVVIGGR